jgi:hypothetical protein
MNNYLEKMGQETDLVYSEVQVQHSSGEIEQNLETRQ